MTLRKAQPITSEIRRMTIPFEVKAVKAAAGGEYAGEIEGYAAGIHNIDSTGDMILPGAFADDLPRFLKEGVICWQHDWMTPIGKPLEAREDSYGLFSKARISNTTCGKDAMTLIRDGVIRKLSIGYRVNEYEFVDRAGLIKYCQSSMPTEKAADVLRQYDELELDGVFLLRNLTLYEWSPVTIPANRNALITGAKSLSLLDGLTFREHSDTVLAAVAGLHTRIQAIAELRKTESKKPNKFHADTCAKLATDLDAVSLQLRALSSSLMIEEAEDEDSAKGRAVFARFLQLEAAACGAL